MAESPDFETFGDKLIRKCKAQPLVPIGALATVIFLGTGFHAFTQGQAAKSQVMMRARVGAQAFTLIAMAAGAYLGISPTDKTPSIEEKLLKAAAK